MELQKSGNSTGPATEVVERQQIAKEQAMRRVRGWTVQNEMRGVRKRARRILDFANPIEIGA